MRTDLRTVLLACLCAVAAGAGAQPDGRSRGELLYSTHCIACHTAQMHWRANRLATDWNTLRGQVRRWQRENRLDWTEEDVEAVAEYLNSTIYRFPRAEGVAAARR